MTQNIVSSNKNLPNLKAREPYALAMLHYRASGGIMGLVFVFKSKFKRKQYSLFASW
jgi:hypothetical protein